MSRIYAQRASSTSTKSIGAMAILGIYELTAGIAGFGILLAIVAEIAFVVLFIGCFRAARD